ncbi:TetR/AcrR family transcriptional regulator [soil metagenome]
MRLEQSGVASPFLTAEQRASGRGAKREALLLAAVRLFNEKGFHAVSLEEVAASMGVTKPTIYHHLGNKDRVLLECVTRGLEQLQEAAERSTVVSGKGIDRLRAFLLQYAAINMEDFGRCVIRTSDELLAPESRSLFVDLKRQVDQALRRLVAEAQADGSIATADVRMSAFALAGALNGPARWFKPDGAMSGSEVASKLVVSLIDGLAPRGDVSVHGGQTVVDHGAITD